MNNTTLRFFMTILFLVGSVSLISACGSVFKLGDMDAVREVNELAIDCKTNEALAALDRVDRGEGLGAAIGDLQRVVILRDAGRVAEANAAMAERNERAGVDAKEAAEAEKSVAKSMEQMRAERQKRTGRRTCD